MLLQTSIHVRKLLLNILNPSLHYYELKTSSPTHYVQVYTAVGADGTGDWAVQLDPPGGGQPTATITVTGNSSSTVKLVAAAVSFGDVRIKRQNTQCNTLKKNPPPSNLRVRSKLRMDQTTAAVRLTQQHSALVQLYADVRIHL